MCRINSEQLQENTSWMNQLPNADSGCWINISGLTEENCSVGKPTDNLKEFKANQIIYFILWAEISFISALR